MKTVMSFLISFILLSIILVSFRARNEELHLKVQTDNAGLKLPEGFSALIVADNIGPGRHIAVNKVGDIYMALSSLHSGKGIAALRDGDGDGKADVVKYFINTTTTGIDISDGFLYYSNYSQVLRIPLAEGELTPVGDPVVIATGFPNQNQHQDKVFALDGSGNLYVNVGAPSNACQQVDRTPGSKGIDPCPQLERQAGIWKFKSDVPGQDQVRNGKRYASGIRNSIALEWNKTNNKLYVVQHGRDQLSQFYPDIYTTEQGAELPAEEFFMVEDGDFFGWPYCYYDHYKKKKVLAPEYGGDAQATGRCDTAKAPIMAFPGHIGPNDLLCYTVSMVPDRYRNGAFVAFHGSWNRAPLSQKGFYVAFVPFVNGLPSGDMEIFADGFSGVKVVDGNNEALHRPTGLAQGPDGSIYVSDSMEGRIWRIMYKPAK